MLSLNDLLTKPRLAASSFPEILPWFGMVSPGLILCQDGSLLAAFAVAGSDVEGREDFFADQKIDLLQQALRTLNDRCTIWSVQERRHISGYLDNKFSNPVAAQIDEEWAEGLRQRKSARITQRFFIGYNFPNQSEAFFEALRAEIEASDGRFLSAFGGLLKRRLSGRGAVARVRGQLAEMAQEFEKLLGAFAGVTSMHLGFERLQERDLLGELYARANLASPRGPVEVPSHLSYLNTLLASDTVVRENDLVRFAGPTQERYVAALSVNTTPPEAHSSVVDRLMNLDCEYVLVQVFKIVDRSVAEKVIQDAEQFYRSEVKSVATRVVERLMNIDSDKVNTGNLHLAEDAQAALVDLTVGDLAYGYYNMTVLGLGETKRQANAAMDELATSLRTSGYAVIRERHGLMSALLTTIPGSVNATLRWKLASTANVADLAPIRTISRGERIHPFFSRLLGHEVPPLCRFATPSGIEYDWNPHVGDVGHTAVVGGTGAGKSTLVGLLLSQFHKYNPGQAFIFDKDHSLMVHTVLHGGQHIDMTARRVRMNPVRKMMLEGDDESLRQWVEVLISADGHTVTGSESSTIHTAIQQLREGSEGAWRLAGLYALIAGQNMDLAAKFATYVNRADADGYGATGAHAHYFDNDEDDFELGTLVGMECGGILGDRKVATPFLEYAFYCIRRRLDGHTPTFIYCEELWYALQNPIFASRFEDWLRTLRKLKAFVVFSTQGLSELHSLPNWSGMRVNIPTQILLPSVAESAWSQAAEYRETFGITEAQLSLVAAAIPKMDYVLVRPDVTRFVRTRMPRTLIAMNDATVQPNLRKAALEYAETGGAGWQLRYLREVLKLAI